MEQTQVSSMQLPLPFSTLPKQQIQHKRHRTAFVKKRMYKLVSEMPIGTQFSVPEMTEKLQCLSHSSIYMCINSMLKKGLISRCGSVVRSGKHGGKGAYLFEKISNVGADRFKKVKKLSNMKVKVKVAKVGCVKKSVQQEALTKQEVQPEKTSYDIASDNFKRAMEELGRQLESNAEIKIHIYHHFESEETSD